MGDEFAWNDRYAGDDAWNEWFDICSVAGCRPEFAVRLAEQVSSAMYSQLSRAGFPREDAHGDDPVAFFDSYFKLRGSRDAKKPLKSYFLHRIKDEGIDMVDFVCGTLFGSGSGRVRDIVLDWIAVLKGWKPRTVSDGEGRRRVVWENAGDENLASVRAALRELNATEVANLVTESDSWRFWSLFIIKRTVLKSTCTVLK